MQRSLSFTETSRSRPTSAFYSHRALTPTRRPSDAHLAARAEPKGFLDAKWPVPQKESVFASSAIKDVVYKMQTTPTGMRRARTAKTRAFKPPEAPAVSFAAFRSLPMPEPLPGKWRLRTQYDKGAFQLGVIYYPYTPADRAASADLEGVIHRALDHPVIPLTVWNGTSAPHNSITGRATTSRYGLNLDEWYKSEMKHAYEVKDFKAFLEAKSSMPRVGVRSEQKIGVGI
ncbi:hypothetical protein KFE25_005934 [Diacronema lutheri]|uniref:Uncharacterized protein n=1 Tax=Diacronema lutheri TaxID=2081491 RepID=A0A8J6CEB1_DIALT|nr:hypothetical protein KFE25_005934 [Diacronema lutheri]